METDLSVGGVLSTAFSVFRARARVLVPIAFGGSLVASALSPTLLGENAVVIIVGFIVGMAFFALMTAVAMAVLRDLRARRPESSAGELLATALPPLPAATLAASLALVGSITAAFLLVAPGLYLMTIWAVLLPVVVVERPEVLDAFGRSRQLVRGNGWKVLGVVLLLGLILVASSPIPFLLQRQVDGPVPHILIGSLVSSFVAPLQVLVLGALYYRLLDLERAESVLEQPGDSPG
jgi:hypothetical protein